MRYIFKFPDIGEGIAEGKILEWYVKKGQEIKSGDSIVKMETDKVVTDIPSPKDGTIVAIFGKADEVINVDDPLIELEIEGVDGEEAQAVAQQSPKEESDAPKEEGVEEKGFGVVGTIEVANDSSFLPAGIEGREEAPKAAAVRTKALATPVARAMAKDLGIDINQIPGSGTNGRVMKEDIKQYQGRMQKGSPAPAAKIIKDFGPEVDVQPMSQIRKAIARNMSLSKQTAAHMTAFEEVEISKLIKVRKQYKAEFEAKGTKLTYLAFVLKAVSKSLKEFPMLNAEADMENGNMIYKNYHNFNIAVDTDDGLVVPVIKNVDQLSIFEISEEIMRLSQKARDRKLEMSDIQGGTFTVTNYGSIGGTFGVPVINYPQVAILGVGRIMEQPVVKKGSIVVGNVLPLSISVDHRVVDGGDTARFLNKLMSYLRDPVSLILF